MVEFTKWAFPESFKELKAVEFEQLRQTASMSVDEYIDKFVELLQYVGKSMILTEKRLRGKPKGYILDTIL